MSFLVVALETPITLSPLLKIYGTGIGDEKDEK
jgi:hypothetical protein